MNSISNEGRRSVTLRVRLVQMLDSLEVAGITPISSTNLHVFAYFVNVLSPVWDVDPLEGSVLKDQRGPFFPDLQRELDRLISQEIVIVSELTTRHERISFSVHLNYEYADNLLALIRTLPDEEVLATFIERLAFSFADIEPHSRDGSALFDAAWSDPKVSNGRVIDFGEWVESTEDNPSWNVSQRFQAHASPGMILNRSEKLSMYMQLMKRRINE